MTGYKKLSAGHFADSILPGVTEISDLEGRFLGTVTHT